MAAVSGVGLQLKLSKFIHNLGVYLHLLTLRTLYKRLGGKLHALGRNNDLCVLVSSAYKASFEAELVWSVNSNFGLHRYS